MADVLIDDFIGSETYTKLKRYIENGVSPIALKGVSEEVLPYITYVLNRDINGSILLIAKDEYKAKMVYEQLSLYDRERVRLFPSREPILYSVDEYSGDNMSRRNGVMSELSEGNNLIVVCSVYALLDKLICIDDFRNNSKQIEFGKTYELNHVIDSLVGMGYERVDMVESRGEFSVRGGILDVYPPNASNPFRVEFFDDEVDSIRNFDIKTQRSIDNLEKICIYPSSEILTTITERENMVKNINTRIESIESLEIGDYKKQNLVEKFRNQVGKLEENMLRSFDLVLPFLESRLCSFLDYFNRDDIIVFDEGDKLEESLDRYYESYENRIKDLMESGELMADHLNLYHEKKVIVDKLMDKRVVSTADINTPDSFISRRVEEKLNIKSIVGYKSNMDMLSRDLSFYKDQAYKTIIAFEDINSSEEFKKEMYSRGFNIRVLDSIDGKVEPGEIVLVEASIKSGFENADDKTVILTYSDIFEGRSTHRKKRKSKKKKKGSKISSFTDLKIGDYVVHEAHGIGKYTGIKQLDVDGVKKDYIIVEYSGDDVLYIPIDQMDLIQKYIGSDSESPKINRLGGMDWKKTKARVKKAVEDMAKDLIKLYAKRETVKGYAFSEDTPWQKQFEDAFPYQETDDQLRAIEEIKTDMETNKPMDRLLCGDVGYGKTEVALRAIFKAVMDSKQVVFLVPTTILVQQHYNNMVERFSEFPMGIESLSRFKTGAQQKKILSDLKSGNIDILIGTHKVLSDNVKFKDLGLLIIDEEQRFGVRQKEKIKGIRESVDVLSLTATPIPRTLHMSLTGIRDMSVIEEPPEERHPVQTYILEYNKQIVRDSILKEMSRDGQVYFLYNKVRSIEVFAAEIKRLVPEARIGVAHGQMGERHLENIMMDFLEREYDVLICTTIIETGLDIPNVNTIIIHDADKMGLSQLYQLRGRVGRSNKLAYAYFTYEKNKILSRVAEKRLKSIKEFTEFGSGFKIAMKDLEIRGAGNLLGAEQHGQMAAIGYDLYVKYLDKAVRKLKGEETDKVEEVETEIEIDVDGYIPNRYIGSEDQKIEIYKRIASIETEEDKLDIVEELIDRFGDIPKQVDNLVKISYIKHASMKIGIESISQKGNKIRLSYRSIEYMDKDSIERVVGKYGEKLQIDISSTPSITYIIGGNSQRKVLSELEDIVTEMNSI